MTSTVIAGAVVIVLGLMLRRSALQRGARQAAAGLGGARHLGERPGREHPRPAQPVRDPAGGVAVRLHPRGQLDRGRPDRPQGAAADGRHQPDLPAGAAGDHPRPRSTASASAASRATPRGSSSRTRSWPRSTSSRRSSSRSRWRCDSSATSSPAASCCRSSACCRYWLTPLPTVPWKLFSIFIGVIQALIFALLTILYFGMAAEGHGGGGPRRADRPPTTRLRRSPRAAAARLSTTHNFTDQQEASPRSSAGEGRW